MHGDPCKRLVGFPIALGSSTLHPVKYRHLGRSGLQVSEVSLGSWLTLGESVARSEGETIVRTAFDGGINFFDTSNNYSGGAAERFLGAVLADLPRSEIIVGTKCFFPLSDSPTNRGLSRKHIVESVNRSLVHLRVEHIDLMQCHRYDETTPLDETVQAMGDLIRQGKVLYWGVSRWTGEQLREAVSICDARSLPRPISQQPPYNVFNRDAELLFPLANELGVGAICYSPLAQGILTGKYSAGRIPEGSRGGHERFKRFMWDLQPERIAVADRLARLSSELGCTPSQLALAWILRRTEVAAVIVGATRSSQLEENMKAVEVELDESALGRIEAIIARRGED